MPGYSVFDVRAGFESEDGVWRVQAYGRNITNKWYWVNVGVETDAIHRAPGMGATYGLGLSYRNCLDACITGGRRTAQLVALFNHGNMIGTVRPETHRVGNEWIVKSIIRGGN